MVNEVQVFRQSTIMGDGVIKLTGKHLIPKCPLSTREVPYVKHFSLEGINGVVEHNMRWAKGIKSSPIFRFAYLSLPTPCNLSCEECFVGKKDGIKPPPHGTYLPEEKPKEIIRFLSQHDGQSIVYCGEGELFLWDKATEFIRYVTDHGMGLTIFTNGTVITKEQIDFLSEREVSLIFSFKDTVSTYHDLRVRKKGAFGKLIDSFGYALEKGLNKDHRLGAEIIVTNENSQRILDDFIPLMRKIDVIPYVEEPIPPQNLCLVYKDGVAIRSLYHDSDQCRTFFEKAKRIDEQFGYKYLISEGTRILAQPSCSKHLIGFSISTDGTVSDCPVHNAIFGNLNTNSVEEIMCSEKTKEKFLGGNHKPCSVCYTIHPESALIR